MTHETALVGYIVSNSSQTLAVTGGNNVTVSGDQFAKVSEQKWLLAFKSDSTGYVLNFEGGFLGAVPYNGSIQNQSPVVKLDSPFVWKINWKDDTTFELAIPNAQVVLDLPHPESATKLWAHDKLNVPNQVWRFVPL